MRRRAPDGSKAFVASAFARLGVFAAIALFLLWKNHEADVRVALPWLLLLGCLLVLSFDASRARHPPEGPRVIVGQAMVVPSDRRVADTEAETALKVDVRNYAYEGKVIHVAARLYQGQPDD